MELRQSDVVSLHVVVTGSLLLCGAVAVAAPASRLPGGSGGGVVVRATQCDRHGGDTKTDAPRPRSSLQRPSTLVHARVSPGSRPIQRSVLIHTRPHARTQMDERVCEGVAVHHQTHKTLV